MNALIRDTGPASPLAETAGAEESPLLRLGNRTVSAVVCPPDAACGYYRATRFDWSGVVRDLR